MTFENIIYLDDIIIVSKTKEDNINTLNKVFQLLSKNNVTLNLSKEKILSYDIKLSASNFLQTWAKLKQ